MKFVFSSSNFLLKFDLIVFQNVLKMFENLLKFAIKIDRELKVKGIGGGEGGGEQPLIGF